MFVYDAVDTEGDPLPDRLLNPFGTSSQLPPRVWQTSLDNLGRDLVHLVEKPLGPRHGGCIGPTFDEHHVRCGREMVRARYELTISSDLDPGAKYNTLAHELGHLYCGHVGTPDPDWWPDRRFVSWEAAEFEAQSVAYLVCGRLGIDTPSARYLHGYLEDGQQVPDISLDLVLTAAAQVERMGHRRLQPRKDDP